jgi:peptide-methionine (S)-S-oxide reductase
MAIITLAGGCFWCTEAIFQRLAGVRRVTPGYTGGELPNPSYEDVVSGKSEYAESVQIEFDSDKVSLELIYRVFFATHDPTSLNRQGSDVGSQYRSAIFYSNNQQRGLAEKVIADLQEEYDQPIVTEVEQLHQFYPAEKYHRGYYARQPQAPYCRAVISPKLAKLKEKFSEKMNSNQL